jgi:large subunit ribosomal protein L21
MYAIFESGSRQYRVEKESVVLIDYQEVKTGQSIELDKVLLYQSGADTLIGRPLVEGARVIAEVIDERVTKKTMTQKFRRRKASKRLKGHTQPYVKIRVKHILKASEAVPATAPVSEPISALAPAAETPPAPAAETPLAPAPSAS